MPDTYNLDPEAIPFPVESFDEFEESITFFTATNRRQAWHYVPGDSIDEEHLLIYFGYCDQGPLLFHFWFLGIGTPCCWF